MKKTKCKTPGVRYAEHPTRRYGPRPDRYFTIRYKLDGRDKEEGLGWASQGMTEAKAALTLGQLKAAQREGAPGKTLADRRTISNEALQKAEKHDTIYGLLHMPFADFVHTSYLPDAARRKSEELYLHQLFLIQKWIIPFFQNYTLGEVDSYKIHEFRQHLQSQGKSPGYITVIISLVRQIFIQSIDNHNLPIANPVKKETLPKHDNKRLRYLTQLEAARLLDALCFSNTDLYHIAIISLFCGLRRKEVCKLAWQNVDHDQECIHIIDTKTHRNRTAYFHPYVAMVLRERERYIDGEYIFPHAMSKTPDNISIAFSKICNAIGLNNGITDRRFRVCFHTLRHTFASWHVQAGTPLYIVKELLGHTSVTTTERYAHLAPIKLQNAVQALPERI